MQRSIRDDATVLQGHDAVRVISRIKHLFAGCCPRLTDADTCVRRSLPRTDRRSVVSGHPNSPQQLARRRAFHARACHPPSRHRDRTIIGAACKALWRDHPGESSASNKPRCGGARQGGGQPDESVVFLSRWARIFSITCGSSMQAMIRSAPPQAAQVWMSMPNTLFRCYAHVIAARRSPGVGGSSVFVFAVYSVPLPRLAGVTRAR